MEISSVYFYPEIEGGMPTLKDFGGFRIVMYFADHNPPHVHVVAPDFEALVSIENCEIFAGKIDAKFRREALEWIASRTNELLRKWSELQ
jgi:hypothetical protein